MRKRHRLKLYDNKDGDVYIILNNCRYYLKDLMYHQDMDILDIPYIGCFDVNVEYGIENHLILTKID